jgi:hypothetical protein
MITPSPSPHLVVVEGDVLAAKVEEDSPKEQFCIREGPLSFLRKSGYTKDRFFPFSLQPKEPARRPPENGLARA